MALKRIQDLGAAATLDGTELVELEQAGGSVQCTTQDIADLAVGTGGDVTGPSSSTDGAPALFDGTTGKLVKDGAGPLGTAAYTASADYATAAQGATADSAIQSVVAGTNVTVDNTDPLNPVVSASSGGGGTDLGWFNVTDYGATGDGSTDDTSAIQSAIDAAETAGGGVVYFPAGVYVVNGALQDTSRGNAQLIMPAIDSPDDEPITIELRGAFAPPPNVSVIGATPTPDSQSVIKGTLNTGTGALLGGWGPIGSFNDNTRVNLVLNDLTIRMPANPVLTAVDASHIATLQADGLFIDTGSYYVQGLAEPTTSTSYGLRMPRNGNGADLALGTVNVMGFYKGYQFGEHSNGFQVNAWGCKVAYEFIAADHASHFVRMMAVHCEKVLTATGNHYVDIEQLNVEHATTGWWVTDQDVDDPSSYLRGALRWHVVLAGTGPDNTFTINGAAGMACEQIGAASSQMAGFIAAPADKSYTLVLKAARRGRIVETVTKCVSGTCTATFKINSTALGGAANSVSTTEQSQLHTSSNVFAAGDDIVLTVSSNSSVADMSFSLRWQPL